MASELIPTIVPRLLVVQSVVTECSEKRQRLDLILLSREASEEFAKKFPKSSDKLVKRLELSEKLDGSDLYQKLNGLEVSKKLEYATKHASSRIVDSSGSLCHERIHVVSGENYHLGDVITEQEAFDFGYSYPHADTVCAKIAQIVVSLKKGGITKTLIEEGLILSDKSALYNSDLFWGLSSAEKLEIFDASRRSEFLSGPQVREQNNKTHPITLSIFKKTEEKEILVGCAFWHPPNNILEFMTYVPTLKTI